MKIKNINLDNIFNDKEFMDEWFSEMLQKATDWEWYEDCSNLIKLKTAEERKEFMLMVHDNKMEEFEIGLLKKYKVYLIEKSKHN